MVRSIPIRSGAVAAEEVSSLALETPGRPTSVGLGAIAAEKPSPFALRGPLRKSAAPIELFESRNASRTLTQPFGETYTETGRAVRVVTGNTGCVVQLKGGQIANVTTEDILVYTTTRSDVIPNNRFVNRYDAVPNRQIFSKFDTLVDNVPRKTFNAVSAERIARYQAKVDAFYAAGVRGEKLAELQGRVQMLSEGFVKVGPGKWNRSGHGIDSIFRKWDNPMEFAILESKWKANFRATHNHESLLGQGYGFRQMDNGWIDANIDNLLNSQHFPMRRRFGELLLEHGYQHRYMNVMNNSGDAFLFTLP